MQRLSNQYKCIKGNLDNRSDHPTAEMIYNDVRKIIPNISLGTVYRNLSRMVKEKEIMMLGIDETAERFDSKIAIHYHFMCKNCGGIRDLNMPRLNIINELAQYDFEGKIEDNIVFFYGLCPECKKSMKKIEN